MPLILQPGAWSGGGWGEGRGVERGAGKEPAFVAQAGIPRWERFRDRLACSGSGEDPENGPHVLSKLFCSFSWGGWGGMKCGAHTPEQEPRLTAGILRADPVLAQLRVPWCRR